LSNFYLRKRIFWHFINTSYHTDRSKLKLSIGVHHEIKEYLENPLETQTS
jgi:hypothetical protein